MENPKARLYLNIQIISWIFVLESKYHCLHRQIWRISNSGPRTRHSPKLAMCFHLIMATENVQMRATRMMPGMMTHSRENYNYHDDVIAWKHFLRYWPFVRGIHRSPVNSPHKDQWRGTLMFSLICAWINVWVNNREAGDLRRHRAHYDVTVMLF